MNENNMRNAVILRAVIMSIFAAVGLYAAYFAVRFSGILFLVYCVALSSVLGFVLYKSGDGLRAFVYVFLGGVPAYNYIFALFFRHFLDHKPHQIRIPSFNLGIVGCSYLRTLQLCGICLNGARVRAFVFSK
ncbi:MAG: hypothetical protein IKI49_06575 [Oscillospiraceae bacterium]|nr:hypothetical protein [Oscillospiraceae bacterium]